MKKLLFILLFIQPLYAADFYETNIKGDRIIVDTIKDVSNKFAPCITLNKWNNEEFLKFTIEGFKFKTDEKTAENTIKLIGDDIEMNCYTSGDDFKAVLIFHKKPASNTYQFKIDGWENYNFYYQYQEQDDVELHPENLVEDKGDYWIIRHENGHIRHVYKQNWKGFAVYHKTKRDYVEGRTNYETGKAWDINRPIATDAGGKKVFVDISIKDGEYTAVIPKDFHDSAKNPLIINDTFGYETTPTYGTDIGNGGLIAHNVATSAPANNGTLTTISIWCDGNGNSSYKLKSALYTRSGTTATYLANSVTAEMSVPATKTKVNGSTGAATITASTTYHWAHKPNNDGVRIWLDSVGDYSGWTAATYEAFPPSTFTAGNDGAAMRFGVYATYSTEAPPSPAVEYEWILSVPTQTDNTNYEWVMGIPSVAYDNTAAPPSPATGGIPVIIMCE